jgi:hypothetical protein
MMNASSRLAVALGMVFAAYVASTYATVSLVQATYGIECGQEFLSSHCDFANDGLVALPSYMALAAFLATVLGFTWLFARHTVAFPFIALIALLCGSAILFDLAVARPVIHAPKIINDTVNILGAVIAASFALILIIVRKEPFSLQRLAWAVVVSFTIKTLSATAFLELRIGVYGATELFLLYLVYAFGAFTLHLMTVSAFVSTLTLRPLRGRA